MARPILRAANRMLSTPSLSRRLLERSLVVFIYHEVSDCPSPFNAMFGLNVSPSAFARHLELIREYFYIIDPLQLVAGSYRTPAALITFDDGNLSYFRNALPILKEKGVPSVAFLNMGTIRGEVCWSGLVTYLQCFERDFYVRGGCRPTGYDFCRFTEPEVHGYLESVDGDALLERVREFRGPLATEADVEAVSDEPLVYLGNHLYNHYNATLLSHRLRGEYRRNQDLLDRHPRGMRLFSYPFSRYNEETTRVIREEGAQAVFAVGGLPNTSQGGDVLYRVELHERVVAQRGMIAEILKNYVGAKCRGAIRLGRSAS